MGLSNYRIIHKVIILITLYFLSPMRPGALLADRGASQLTRFYVELQCENTVI